MDAMEARGLAEEGAPLPSETVRAREAPPRPVPGKERRPLLLRETLAVARSADQLPPRRDAARPAPIPAWQGGARLPPPEGALRSP